VKSAFRTYGFCLFFLLFACLRAASGQDSPIVRGPFGKPVGLYDEGGNLTIPITVYEDSQVEILIPDITGEGWTQWHTDQYRTEGKYWVTLYSFFKGKARCLGTAGTPAQSGCVAYARYEQQMISVNTGLHTVKFFGVTAYAGERTEPLGVHPAPSGSYAITALDPGLAKAINKISAIVKDQMDSYAERMINADKYAQKQADDARATQKAAEQGNAIAQFNLGILYGQGKGVPQDYPKAAFWYRKAAEQGNANAQLNLGNAYRTGQGVTRDDAEAVVWYRKAAEQGDAAAQWSLGVSYEYGQGVPQSYADAYFWLDIAALGKFDVSSEKDNSARHLSSAVLFQTQEGAQKWFETHIPSSRLVQAVHR
jgi:TPR repeat protein